MKLAGFKNRGIPARHFRARLFPRPFLAWPEGSGVQTICYTAGGSGGLELVLPQAFICETHTKEIGVLWENETLTVLKLSQPQAYLYCLLCTDTAAVYRNEKAIGDALKELSRKHRLNPEDIFITSKLGMESPWSPSMVLPIVFIWLVSGHHPAAVMVTSFL